MPKNVLEVLARLTVDVPCHEDWEKMTGDRALRSCAACKKHVFDLTQMRADEVAVLLVGAPQPPCVRFYRRPDGRIATADCGLTCSNEKRRTEEAVWPKQLAGKNDWKSRTARVRLLIAIPAVALGITALLFQGNVNRWWREPGAVSSAGAQATAQSVPEPTAQRMTTGFASLSASRQ